jgi:transposase
MPKNVSPLPNLSEMTHAEKDALILALLERLAAIEGKLPKDSHNSSKPPSSDGLKRRPKSLKPKSNAKAGGQAGHLGITLKQSALVDRTIIHTLPSACDVCGASLAGRESVLANERRQVIDLPPIRFEVIEHRILRTQCTCGAQHCSDFPKEVPGPVQYGAGVQGAAVYFTQYQQLPYQRCANAFRDLFGIRLAASTLVNYVKKAATHLAPAVAQIKESIVESPVVHFDETGMRVGKKLTWVHSASTRTATWYGHHTRRGEAAMNALDILPRYQGVAVHDGLASYRQYACLHALCNAHHLRELVYVFESTEQQWARDMMHLLCAAKEEMVARPDPHAALSAERYADIKAAYRALIAQGMADNPAQLRSPDEPIKRGRVKQSTAHNLLNRLHAYIDDVLRFITDPNVPFDNNQAERDLRMQKLKQKISGCFRTTDGIAAFCTIRSYLATLRKNQKDLLQALTQTFAGNVPAAV